MMINAERFGIELFSNIVSDPFSVRRWGVFAIGLGVGLLAGWSADWRWAGLAPALYAWFLLAVAVVDLEQRRIRNRLLLAALPLTLLLSLWFSSPPLFSALLGGGVGFALFAAIALARPGAMGWGDVKLAGIIGLMLGFPGVLYALSVGMIAGGVAALALLLTGRAKRSDTIAYAPYLVLGALLALFFA